MRRGGAPSAGVVLKRGGGGSTNRGGSHRQFVLGIDRGFVIIEKAHAYESANCGCLFYLYVASLRSKTPSTFTVRVEWRGSKIMR
jgi:hypothetical protein